MRTSNFRKKLALVFASSLCLAQLLFPAAVLADTAILTDPCEGVADSAYCDSSKPQPPGDNELYGPNGVLTKIADIIATVVGVAAVIVIIIGGIRYALSSGDSQNINGAKNAIMYAIIGLIVALLAKAVVLFVLSKL